jgi:hypothetical protein
MNDRDDLLAPALARSARHHDVVDRRVVLQGTLDLFREDLLAARVDRDRVAPEDVHRAVGAIAGAIAGNGVAGRPDPGKGALGLRGVAEVSERHPPVLSEPADLVVRRLEHP